MPEGLPSAPSPPPDPSGAAPEPQRLLGPALLVPAHLSRRRTGSSPGLGPGPGPGRRRSPQGSRPLPRQQPRLAQRPEEPREGAEGGNAGDMGAAGWRPPRS